MTRSIDPIPEPRQPGELFVAFANTLSYERGTPVDELADSADLLTWLYHEGLLSERGRAAELQRLDRDPDEAERRLARFRYLRDLLHQVAERATDGRAPTQEQVRHLNHVLRHGLHYHRLETERDGARYALTQVGDRLDQARATIASSFAQFLASEGVDRLRVCGNRETCAEVFIDRSPTGRRRWCDMRVCGNQAKVARHRARARLKGSPEVSDGREGVPAPEARD